MASFCTCGRHERYCDRRCPGSIAQQNECAREGRHVTSRRLYEEKHGVPYPVPGPQGNFCFRCGAYEIVRHD
jgi:hypothetical protein